MENQRFARFFSRYTQEQMAKFQKFHAENPQVYQTFMDLAIQMRNSGRTKYSAETIVNVMRWHIDLQTTGSEFKISNNFRSMYARFLAYNRPEFEKFFDFQGMDKNTNKKG